MACYPWVVPYERQQQDLKHFPHLAKWFERIAQRPATTRAYALADAINTAPVVDEESRKLLFGQDASSVH
ncbi:Disulfide-bond oxidoreductase YfcG [compost metagenome]